MNPQKTPSILQRMPVILAVTAASYGLPAQAQPRYSSECSADAAPHPLSGTSAGHVTRETAALEH